MNDDADVQKLSSTVKVNLDTVAGFYERDNSTISRSQNLIEHVSMFFSSVIYFIFMLVFICGWIALGYWIPTVGIEWPDPSPYPILQGIICVNALFITIAVLMRQNHLTRLEEKRDHFNLQVNLLAEQKVTKIIQLLEELRQDLPNVKTRVDPQTETLKVDTDHHAILNAIETHSSIRPR